MPHHVLIAALLLTHFFEVKQAGYVAEDGTTPYVAEDGVTAYVLES